MTTPGGESYTVPMLDPFSLPRALDLIPDDENPADFLETLYCKAVPIMADLCGKDSPLPERVAAYVKRMESLFPGRPVSDTVSEAVAATEEVEREDLPFLVNYVIRSTRPFLDDANALTVCRYVVDIAGDLSDAGWSVLLSWASAYFLTKEDILRSGAEKDGT